MAVTQPMLALPITIASNINITVNFAYLKSVTGADSFTATLSAGTYYNHFDSGGLVAAIVTALNAAETSEGSGGTWTDVSTSVADLEGVTVLRRTGDVDDELTSLQSAALTLIGTTGSTMTFSLSSAGVYQGTTFYQRKYVWLPREWPIFATTEVNHILSMDKTRGGKKRYRYFKELQSKDLILENIPAALVYQYYADQTIFCSDVRNSADAGGLTNIVAGDPNICLESFVRWFLNDTDEYVTDQRIRFYKTWNDDTDYEDLQFSDLAFMERLSTNVKVAEKSPLWYNITIPLEEYIA